MADTADTAGPPDGSDNTVHTTHCLRRLHALPRVRLAPLPTPLHRLERFSSELGADVWMKRDDIGGPGLAGNKVRKYELVLGAALQQRADTLITTGAVQSNSARAGAAAAAQLGLRCILVLTGPRPAHTHANLLLDSLFGAEVRFAGSIGWAELTPLLEDVATEVRAAGGAPVIAPVGASSPLGSLGFAVAYQELLTQLDATPAADTATLVHASTSGGTHAGLLVHASTSGGTHAGLIVGRALAGRGPAPVAIDAGPVLADPAADIAQLANAAAGLIGLAERFAAQHIDVRLDHGGPAYGSVTPQGVAAIRLLARTEGIVCDPVYSGKGLAGLVAMARDGALGGQRVVFWHTGGWHAVFDPHYGDALR